MGITIHYRLSTQKEWTDENVREWLEIVADYARHLGCAHVGSVVSAYKLAEVTAKLHKVGRKGFWRFVPINPTDGWAVEIEIGKGCEPLVLALCKYPARWRTDRGRLKIWHPTKISREWQFGWFCKTQFAGQHGAAHFLRCHKTVISLLDFCRKAGLEVMVKDEAGYWEQRDEAGLAKTLRRSEALLAAFGGLMKDMADTPGGPAVESPIFDYANFEHLEQEGWEHFGIHFEKLRSFATP